MRPLLIGPSRESQPKKGSLKPHRKNLKDPSDHALFMTPEPLVIFFSFFSLLCSSFLPCIEFDTTKKEKKKQKKKLQCTFTPPTFLLSFLPVQDYNQA